MYAIAILILLQAVFSCQKEFTQTDMAQYAISYLSHLHNTTHMMRVNEVKNNVETPTGETIMSVTARYSKCEIPTLASSSTAEKNKKAEKKAKEEMKSYWKCEVDEESPIYDCKIQWNEEKLVSVSCRNPRNGRVMLLNLRKRTAEDDLAQYGLAYLSLWRIPEEMLQIKTVKSDKMESLTDRVMQVTAEYSVCKPKLITQSTYEKKEKLVVKEAKATVESYRKCELDKESPLFHCTIEWNNNKLSSVSCDSRDSGESYTVTCQRLRPDEDRAQYALSYFSVMRETTKLIRMKKLKSDKVLKDERVTTATAQYSECMVPKMNTHSTYKQHKEELDKAVSSTMTGYYICAFLEDSPLYECEIIWRNDVLASVVCKNLETKKITTARVQRPSEPEDSAQYGLAYWSLMRVPEQMMMVKEVKNDKVELNGGRTITVTAKFNQCPPRSLDFSLEKEKVRKAAAAKAASLGYYWECDFDHDSPLYKCEINYREKDLNSVSCENSATGNTVSLRVKKPSKEEDIAQYGISYWSVQQGIKRLVLWKQSKGEKMESTGEHVIMGTAQYSHCIIPYPNSTPGQKVTQKAADKALEAVMQYYWECEFDENSPLYECEIRRHKGKQTSVSCKNPLTGKRVVVQDEKKQDKAK